MNVDVAIIGGSLAGIVAGVTLADAGVSVIIFEKNRFPRRKPCGEGISYQAFALLTKLRFPGLLDSDPLMHLQGYRAWIGRTSYELVAAGKLIGIARQRLDANMHVRCREHPNITFLEGTRVDNWKRLSSSFDVRFGPEKLQVKELILADGTGGQSVRPERKKALSKVSVRCGVSAHFEVVSGELPPWVQVFTIPDGEIFLTPVEPELLNISCIGTSRCVSAVVNERKGSYRPIAHAVTLCGVTIRQTEPWTGAIPLNSQVWGPEKDGAYVIGDACETLDPVGGMGMTHAVLSGYLASKCLLDVLLAPKSARGVWQYAREREIMARPLRGFTRLASFGLSSRTGRSCFPAFAWSGLSAAAARSIHDDSGKPSIPAALLRWLGTPGGAPFFSRSY